VTSAPGDTATLYVVEQPGTIVMVRGGQVTGTFLDIRDRVKSGGEQGVLSVAFHPGYATNHLFYVDYTDLNGDTHVTEFRSANGVGDPTTGRDLLFVKQPDVGAAVWEEIDFRPKAKIGALANYGWPRFEGNVIYPTYGVDKKLVHKGVLVSPVWVYSHALGCAVTGGYVYRGSRVTGARGRYFFGDFCSGTLWSFAVGRTGRASAISPIFDDSIPNISSFGEGGNGELYAVSLDGALYQLQ